MNTAKKFKDVFQKIKFSPEVTLHLADATINTLRLKKAVGQLDVSMNLGEIINESCLADFEAQLKEQLPYINCVDIRLKYSLKETDYTVLAEKCWPNILYQVGVVSPICAQILSRARWNVDGSNLVITVKHNTKFLFVKKGMDKLVQQMLDQRFGPGLKVIFEDEPTGDKPNKKPEVEYLPAPAPVLKPTTPIPQKAKAYGGRKATIKVNTQITGKQVKLSGDIVKDVEVVAEGLVFEAGMRETKNGWHLYSLDITDNTDSLTVKFFVKPEAVTDELRGLAKKGVCIRAKGKIQYDEFTHEFNMLATEIGLGATAVGRSDEAQEKRIELHLHTQMSEMDGISPVKDYIKRAIAWGHKAIAVTDHGVLQAFPEACEAARGSGLKVIYGLEAYIIDDLGAVVQCSREQTLDDVFTVFDIETTGLSKDRDKIIEIGAVKVSGGEIVDTFSSFVNPGRTLPQEIVSLTGITDEMLKDAPRIEDVLPEFLAFAGSSIMVAHNAGFDMGFVRVAAKLMQRSLSNSVLDTVELSRTMFPDLPRHKLNVVAKHLGIELKNHHRAVDDAQATAHIFLECRRLLREKNIHTLEGINLLASEAIEKKKLKAFHAVILVKNKTGLRNLYELVSKAHIHYFYKRPRIPKSEFIKLREGLIIGTGCEAGEFYKAVLEDKPDDFIRSLAEFYDYFEIQPTANNMYLVRGGQLSSKQDLIDINKKIVHLGELYRRPVVATGDVHFLEPQDEIYRRIIMHKEGFKDADNQAPLYFKTTEEMLLEFQYLGEQKAKEVVVDNTHLIAEQVENILPIPDETYVPKIEGAEGELRRITLSKAQAQYGEELPAQVAKRLEKELNAIIKNGFAVMYIIAQKLVWKSLEDGYLVGSRGSVGSSFVATMSGITEVNPLPPHYVCPSCKYVDFDSESVKTYAGGSGCDMPDKPCPVCQTALNKEGHDIPFETFLGFDGDKEPDIDLNFSGEYQANAHAYAEELFGAGFVFKAGTIGTLADRTAYAYVKDYIDTKGLTLRSAEINRLKLGCTGIKKLTGQHPGGLMVVPAEHSIYEFTPVQRPANDMKSSVTTTHFDYNALSGRLLKLDILGHDVPTMIRMLQDGTGIDPTTVDLGDKKVLSLFTSPAALGVTPEDIGCQTGSLGLPEFGTNFVRGMLIETQPASFAELVRISGLSHGTDVWFNNAQELIRDGRATLKEVIPTRDDIMVYLISKGVEKIEAFKIMENVRKGKGLTENEAEIMHFADVPDWYIESCRRIKYMFPKGHAVAYVMMTVRIGYFKINYPLNFYAASFSVKAEDFDYELMCSGPEKVQEAIVQISALGKEATATDKDKLTMLELVREMYARGLHFAKLDVYRAHPSKFSVTPEGLMPPLCAVQGLGASVAQNIVNARADGEFISIEDFKERTKTNKTVIALLKHHDVLAGLPESSQLTLF